MRLFVINLLFLQTSLSLSSTVPLSSTDPTKHHQQHKQNTKRSETKTRGISPFPINSAWPQSRNLWSSFNENFFNGGFPDASFGDWKSKIEERSNKVLDRYDSSPSIPEEPFKGTSVVDVSKPRARSLPNSNPTKPLLIKPENTLYRQNVIDDFVEKIIEPQLKKHQHQKHDHVTFKHKKRHPIKNFDKTLKRQVIRNHEHYKPGRAIKNTENIGVESIQSQNFNSFPRSKNQDSFVAYSAKNDKINSMPFSKPENVFNEQKSKTESPIVPFTTTSTSLQTSVSSTIPSTNTFKGFSSEEIKPKNFKFIEGPKLVQQFAQERSDDAEKRNDGFFTEGFLKFGPNNIRNFADLFKQSSFDQSGFEDLGGDHGEDFSNQHHHEEDFGSQHDDYDESGDTFIPTQYDDDDTNINYADDYYEGHGESSFEEPNFIQDAPDFGTSFDRDTSFDSFSSYEDTDDEFQHTGPGNDFSDNKPKREVFNGNHQPNHANNYEPFQYDDGEFSHLPSVEQQPHQNRHHHPQPHHHNDDKSYHHSFGNNNNNANEEYSDESFDVSTHDIEGFKEGPFGNANSNFVKSEIEQNIQHSSSIEPDYQQDDIRDNYGYASGERYKQANSYEQEKQKPSSFGSFGSFESSETSSNYNNGDFETERVKRKPSPFGSFEGFENSGNSNSFNSGSENSKPPQYDSFELFSSAENGNRYGAGNENSNPPPFNSFESFNDKDIKNEYHSESEEKRPSNFGAFNSFNSQNNGNSFNSNSDVTQTTPFGSFESYDNTNTNKFSSERTKRKPSGFSSFDQPENEDGGFDGPVEFSHFGGSSAFEGSFEQSTFSSISPPPPRKETKYQLKNYRAPIGKIGTESNRSNKYKRENSKTGSTYKSRSSSQSIKGIKSNSSPNFSSIPSRKSSYYPDYKNVNTERSSTRSQ